MQRKAYTTTALRKLILLRETGPKSAAWHRARVQLIWRLHRQLAQDEQPAEVPLAPSATLTPPDARATN